jgi:hypothetical protein
VKGIPHAASSRRPLPPAAETTTLWFGSRSALIFIAIRERCLAASMIVIDVARHFTHSMRNYRSNHSEEVPIRAGSITSGPERAA